MQTNAKRAKRKQQVSTGICVGALFPFFGAELFPCREKFFFARTQAERA